MDQLVYNNIDVTTITDNYVLSGYDSSFVKYENSNDPTIYLKVNETLQVNVNSPGQPLTIMDTTYDTAQGWSSQQNKTQNNGVQISGTITTYPNGTDSTTITWTPTSNGTYYYQSSNSANSFGEIGSN